MVIKNTKTIKSKLVPKKVLENINTPPPKLTQKPRTKTISKSINVKSKIVNKTIKKIEKPKTNIVKNKKPQSILTKSKTKPISKHNANVNMQNNMKNPRKKITHIKPKSVAVVEKSSPSKSVGKVKAKALSDAPNKLRSAKPKINPTSPIKAKPLPTLVKIKPVNIAKSIKTNAVSKPKSRSKISPTSAKSNSSGTLDMGVIQKPTVIEEAVIYPANTVFISTMLKLCEKYNVNIDNLASWDKIFTNINAADRSAEILKDFYTNPENALKRMNDITAVPVNMILQGLLDLHKHDEVILNKNYMTWAELNKFIMEDGNNPIQVIINQFLISR